MRNGQFKKLAIPNPELAPYGAAACDVLRYGWRRAGGDAALLQKWIDRLGLQPGVPVWAQIKAVALLVWRPTA